MAAKKASASSSTAGAAWYEPGLMAPCVAGEKLKTMLLLTMSNGNEWGETMLRVAPTGLGPTGSNFFPFLMHNIYSG